MRLLPGYLLVLCLFWNFFLLCMKLTNFLCFSDRNLMNLQPDTGIKTVWLTRRCGGKVSSMAVLIVQTFAINLRFSVFADLGRSKGLANYIAWNVPIFFLNEGAGFSFFSWFACSILLHCVTCESRCLLPLFQFSFSWACELQVSRIFGVSFCVRQKKRLVSTVPWLLQNLSIFHWHYSSIAQRMANALS